MEVLLSETTSEFSHTLDPDRPPIVHCSSRDYVDLCEGRAIPVSTAIRARFAQRGIWGSVCGVIPLYRLNVRLADDAAELVIFFANKSAEIRAARIDRIDVLGDKLRLRLGGPGGTCMAAVNQRPVGIPFPSACPSGDMNRVNPMRTSGAVDGIVRLAAPPARERSEPAENEPEKFDNHQCVRIG
jgi:hypothetical protein